MKEKFSLTPESVLPYLAFTDFQSYAESLTMKELKSWDKKFTAEVPPGDGLIAAMAIALREMQVDEYSFTQKEVETFATRFHVGIGIMAHIRKGSLKIIKGRISLTNPTAELVSTKL